ncbi:hypothetical protein [Streptosporangium sp. LJ11]
MRFVWDVTADCQATVALAAARTLGIDPAAPDVESSEIPADGSGVIG